MVMKRFTHRSKFNGDRWITRRWETDIKPPWIKPLDMIAGVHFVPQLVDKVGADVIRIDVEVSRFGTINMSATDILVVSWRWVEACLVLGGLDSSSSSALHLEGAVARKKPSLPR